MCSGKQQEGQFQVLNDGVKFFLKEHPHLFKTIAREGKISLKFVEQYLFYWLGDTLVNWELYSSFQHKMTEKVPKSGHLIYQK